MIITKEVNVKTTNQTYKYYQELGYNIKCYDYVNVKIIHLSKGSHIKVKIKCDICQKEFEFEFRGISSKINEKYECKSCMSKRLIKDGKRGCFTKEINQRIANNTKIKMLDEHYKKEHYKKVRKTKLKRYKNETYNNQEKRKNTLLENFGGENYNNRGKCKNTKLKNHGDENYNNQDKKRDTCLKKYGVYHTNQVPKIFERIQISAFKLKTDSNTNLKYRGSYEKHFLDYCFFKNININNFEGNIKYTDKNVYYPDFYLKELNLIVEIKSTYTFDMDYDKNILKETACKKLGYNFIFVMDKKYTEFEKLLITQ